MSGEVTVGIDIGTTSVKAVAADGDGNVLARARVPHRLVVPSADRMEHDARQAWRRGPRRALAAVQHANVRGIGLAAMVPSLTAVNVRGIPLTPGLLYGDARGRTGSDGNPATSGEGLAFLRWTASTAPDAAAFWPAQAVASCAISGEAFVDFAVAASYAPPFKQAGWDAEQLAALGLRSEQLPRVIGIGEVGARVNDAVVVGGTVDALAEQIVAGGDRDGDVLVGCGTTLLTWAVSSQRHEAPGLWTVPHIVPGRHLIGGASNAGGLFLGWAAAVFRGGRDDRVDPAHVPIWLPYVRGERTPYHDPDRRAELHDVALVHDAAAIRRAAYEAAGFVVRHHLDLAGVEPQRLVATGGGTRVGAWMQALADCTGVPVDVVAVPEGAALGAAFMARFALGLESSLADAGRWARIGRRVEPRPVWQPHCDERYARFRALSGDP